MPDETAPTQIPPGFKLRHTLRGPGTIYQDGMDAIYLDTIHRIAWSPDGQTLAWGGEDKRIRLWDTKTGELRRTLKGHPGYVHSVAWSPDGRFLASAGGDSIIRVRYATTGKSRHNLEGHLSKRVVEGWFPEVVRGVNSVAWSPDGQALASGGDDRTVRLWDAATGQLRFTLEGHSAKVYTVAWSPDGRTLASGGGDKIMLWDVATGRPHRTLEVPWSVFSVAWSPDGRMLASAGNSIVIPLWDAATGQLKSILEGHTSWITSVSFSSDGRHLASKSEDNTVRLWRCDTWATVAVLNEKSSPYWPPSLAFSPREANVLATLGEKDSVVRIWDLYF